MLKHQLIHPRINEVLGRAGHHSAILIADGNYPAWNKRGPEQRAGVPESRARRRHLRASPARPAQRRARRSRQYHGHSAGRSVRASRRAAGLGGISQGHRGEPAWR